MWLVFLSVVQGGTVGRLGADGAVWTGTVGESITGTCYFRIAGSKKRFCKETCDKGTILIETDQTDHTDHKGRYSLHYEYNLLGYNHLHVTIRDLTKADSGRYTCQLVRYLAPDSSEGIELIVEDGEFLPKVFECFLSQTVCDDLIVHSNNNHSDNDHSEADGATFFTLSLSCCYTNSDFTEFKFHTVSNFSSEHPVAALI